MGKKFVLAVIIFFAVLAGWNLLQKGLPPTHDGEYHVIRFYEFSKTFWDGNFYPRWAPDLNKGYGLPLFNYVYPLPNYLSLLLHFLGISFIDAFKLNLFLATIFGAIFMYFWARQFWGSWGGLVSSIFYTYSPYHFLDIYIRGSIGEVWALALFPAFLWTATKYFKEKNNKLVALSGLFLALIIFSHNILALMFFPFALFYLGFLIYQSNNRKYLILNTSYLILLGLGLSVIFWLPALWEQNYVTGLRIYNYQENFPELYQLIFPSWGSGFSGGAFGDQMSFQIGVANLLTVFLSLLATIKLFKKKDDLGKTLIFFLSCFVFIFLLMLKISLPIWKAVPLMNYFQFPWRFLSLEILIASFLAGSLLKVWPSKIFGVGLVSLVFLLGIGYTKVAYYHQRDDNYYLTRSNFIEGTNSPGDSFNTIWMAKNIDKKNEKIILTEEEGEVKTLGLKTTHYSFNISAKKDLTIHLNAAYFPGWTVFVNGEEVKISPDREGRISFDLKKGDNQHIEVTFRDTNIRKIALVISLLSVAVSIYLFLK